MLLEERIDNGDGKNGDDDVGKLECFIKHGFLIAGYRLLGSGVCLGHQDVAQIKLNGLELTILEIDHGIEIFIPMADCIVDDQQRDDWFCHRSDDAPQNCEIVRAVQLSRFC